METARHQHRAFPLLSEGLPLGLHSWREHILLPQSSVCEHDTVGRYNNQSRFYTLWRIPTEKRISLLNIRFPLPICRIPHFCFYLSARRRLRRDTANACFPF